MEELIGILIGAIIVIAIIGWIIGAIGILLQAAWISWPSWVIAGVIMFIVYQWHNSKKNERTDLYLLKTIKANCIVDKLNWSLDDTEIKSFSESEYSDIEIIAPILGGIAAIVIFVIIQSNGWFSGEFFWPWDSGKSIINPEMGTFAGFVATAGIVVAIAFLLHPKKTAEALLKERADELISRINNSLQRTNELDSFESSIKVINAKLNISFPIDFRLKLQQFVNANTQTLLRDVAPLNRLIAEIITEAQVDVAQLEKASELYSGAKSFYTETAKEVSKAGSSSLLALLDHIHTVLHSENLKILLQNRDWNSFYGAVNAMLEEMMTTKEAAVKYRESGIEDEPFPTTETNEEKACRILNVPINATADQIKKMYKTLASIYHPDSNTVKDDTRMKEINWAYDFLIKLRN